MATIVVTNDLKIGRASATRPAYLRLILYYQALPIFYLLSGKQRYKCKVCNRQFIEFYKPPGYDRAIKEKCLEMYVNGI